MDSDLTPRPADHGLSGHYEPNFPGAASLRDARALYIDGKHVTAEVHGREITIFVGTLIEYAGPLPESVTQRGQINTWVAEYLLSAPVKAHRYGDPCKHCGNPAYDYNVAICSDCRRTAERNGTDALSRLYTPGKASVLAERVADVAAYDASHAAYIAAQDAQDALNASPDDRQATRAAVAAWGEYFRLLDIWHAAEKAALDAGLAPAVSETVLQPTITAGDVVTVEDTRGLATDSPVTTVHTGIAYVDSEGTMRADGVNVTRDADGHFPHGVVLVSVRPGDDASDAATPIVLDVQGSGRELVAYRVRFATEDQALAYMDAHSAYYFAEVESEQVPDSCKRLLDRLHPRCEHGMSADLCYGPAHYATDEEIRQGW
jgi:hypothetical protein